MRIAFLGGALLLATALSACSSVPLVEYGAYAPQMKSASVQAWNALASDLAVKAYNAANEHQLSAEDRVVFLANDEAGTAFQQGLRELLATELAARNFKVVADPRKARLVLRESAMVVQHEKEKTAVSPLAAVGYMLTLGLAFDPATEPTYTEVLLNTTLTAGTDLVLRDSRTFYVQPGDVALYSGRGR